LTGHSKAALENVPTIPICTFRLVSAEGLPTAQIGGYLESSVDNAWWAGISAA
jgi:hypothetical protein